jgi:glycosyltransferase involved in cell wall biosynthesis
VIPVYNEGKSILSCLERLTGAVKPETEILVVYDMEEDTTVPFVAEYSEKDPRVRGVLNTYGRGPANAIRFGLDSVDAPVGVVTMADLSDDFTQINELASLVDGDVVVAAASRYMRGGKQLGAPLIKSTLSRLAGLSLFWLGRVGTRDATNSFKAYSTDFIRRVGIDSRSGFEIGIELVAKAKRNGLRVVEIPTTWRERSEGESRFKVLEWIPVYLRWYFYALGRQAPQPPNLKGTQ